MMRLFKITLITLVIYLVSIPLVSCASKSDSAALLENQVVTVQRGNLTIDITSVGNLALSHTADLAFEMDGTVEEVLVKEADSVEEGQVLANLDTSAWEDAVIKAQRGVTTKKRDMLQAEINLRNAEIALETAQDTYTWPQLVVAQADLNEAKEGLEWILDSEGDYESNDRRLWERLAASAERNLITAKATLEAMLSGADTEEVAIKKLQVELAQGKLEDAQIAIEDAQKALAEARNASPEITAPFTGFITKVNVKGGDEVKKGTVAVQLADPTKFEAEVMVSEVNILQVKLGGAASVQVEAVPGVSLPAKVTHISPTATIQSGVVNYTVKVEIQSLQSAMQERQQASDNLSEEMMKQRQQEQEGQTGQMPAMLPEDFQLREGLTVTVSITTAERNDVLLVPNGAITRRGRETYVQVLKDGAIEERSITVGISNWQYTEVISGLSEGEQVIVPQVTATTPTTPQRQRAPGEIRFFGP